MGYSQTLSAPMDVSLSTSRWFATGGIVDLLDEANRAKLMVITPVEEMWRLQTHRQTSGPGILSDYDRPEIHALTL